MLIEFYLLILIIRLKTDAHRKSLVSRLYDSWTELYFTKQTILLEAVEQLLVNAEVKSKALQGLRSIDKLKDESQKSHGIIFVDDKILSLYSTKHSQTLSATDLVFITIFIHTMIHGSPTLQDVSSELLFLNGFPNGKHSGCIPSIVHISRIHENIVLVLLIEHNHLILSNHLFDSFFAIQKLKNVQSQGDIDNMKQYYESMDVEIKHVLDSLKKIKNNSFEVEEMVKIFGVKWEVLKKGYVEYFKTKQRNALLKIESNLPKINDALQEVFHVSKII